MTGPGMVKLVAAQVFSTSLTWLSLVAEGLPPTVDVDKPIKEEALGWG